MTVTKKKISKGATRRHRRTGDPIGVALSVYDGTSWVGSIVAQAGTFLAFNVDGELLGKFQTQRMAVIALPRAAS
jgi:hypothetical protein